MTLKPLTLGPERENSRIYWDHRYAQINRLLDNATNPDTKLKILNALHRAIGEERDAFEGRSIVKPIGPSAKTPALSTAHEIRAHSLQLTNLYLTVERMLLNHDADVAANVAGQAAPAETVTIAVDETSAPSPARSSAPMTRIPWKTIGAAGVKGLVETARFTALATGTIYRATAPLRKFADKHISNVSKFAITQIARSVHELDWIVQQEIIYPLFKRSFDNRAAIDRAADHAKQKPKLAASLAFSAVAAPVILAVHLISTPKPEIVTAPEDMTSATQDAPMAYTADVNPEPDDIPRVQAQNVRPAFNYKAWVAKQNRYLNDKYKLDKKSYTRARPSYDYALAAAPDLNVPPPPRGKWNWDALLYNSKYEALLIDAAEKMLNQRPGDVFRGIVMTESGGRQHGPNGETIRSPKNAIGIAQVLPSTGAYIAPKCFGENIDWDRFYNDKDYNYEAGRCYFKEQHDQFGNPILGALAYNGGPKGLEWRMQAYGKAVKNTPEGMVDFMRSIKNPENRHYVPATMVKLGLISVNDLGPDVYSRPQPKTRAPR